MNPTLLQYINALDDQRISDERKIILNNLAELINRHLIHKSNIDLLFVCTHNSRRSIFSQVWASIAAWFFGKSNIKCYSGGTEATAIYPTVISTLQEAGLNIEPNKQGYLLELEPLKTELSSKLFNDPQNPKNNFMAIMTCNDADENCPFIPGNAGRFALNYKDPKFADQTDKEHQIYFEKSMEIANEMFYLFSKIK